MRRGRIKKAGGDFCRRVESRGYTPPQERSSPAWVRPLSSSRFATAQATLRRPVGNVRKPGIGCSMSALSPARGASERWSRKYDWPLMSRRTSARPFTGEHHRPPAVVQHRQIDGVAAHITLKSCGGRAAARRQRAFTAKPCAAECAAARDAVAVVECAAKCPRPQAHELAITPGTPRTARPRHSAIDAASPGIALGRLEQDLARKRGVFPAVAPYSCAGIRVSARVLGGT